MEFGELGKYCVAEGCGQKDFLPFTCKYCQGSFCLQHQSIRDHGCSKAPDKVLSEASPSAETVTTKERKDKKEKAKKDALRCRAAGCKERTAFNLHNCKHCRHLVCLSHRLAWDHDCPQPPGKKQISTSVDPVTGASLTSMKRVPNQPVAPPSTGRAMRAADRKRAEQGRKKGLQDYREEAKRRHEEKMRQQGPARVDRQQTPVRPSADIPSNMGPWHCSVCRFTNFREQLSQCERCGAKRGQIQSTDQDTDFSLAPVRFVSPEQAKGDQRGNTTANPTPETVSSMSSWRPWKLSNFEKELQSK
eukprot:g4236.t1